MTLILAIFAAASLSTPPAAWPTETDITPEDQRAILNRVQADFARHQLEENDVNRRAYEEAVKAREIEIKSRQEEYERLLREHEKAMERWRADVAACEAGDVRRCGRYP